MGEASARGQSVVGVRIPERVEERVAAAGRAAGATLFAVWQGVFAVWAWRRMEREESEAQDGGNTDDAVLVVGPYGRRDEARFQRTVGYLLNMLVYKYEVGGKG